MIVLDASALVDVVTNRPARDQVLDHLDQRLIAPSHQPTEVLSALARLVRADELSPAEARQALSDVSELRQDLVVPDRRQLWRALELVDRIRVLGGLYVALAEERSCAILTTDSRLAHADPPCEVLLVPADDGRH